MKVLVRAQKYCHKHQVNQDPLEELVISASCFECDPTRVLFLGVENGETAELAMVVDRPDINFDLYVGVLRLAVKRFLHVEADRKTLRNATLREAQHLAEVANSLPVTALVRREASNFYASVPFEDQESA